VGQFYADIQGNRGAASRMGSKDSGISGHIRGWHVGGSVSCDHDDKTGKDQVLLSLTGGSSGHSIIGMGSIVVATCVEGARPVIHCNGTSHLCDACGAEPAGGLVVACAHCLDLKKTVLRAKLYARRVKEGAQKEAA